MKVLFANTYNNYDYLYCQSKKTQKSLASVMNLKISQKGERIFNI
jgi:hypothetical protein